MDMRAIGGPAAPSTTTTSFGTEVERVFRSTGLESALRLLNSRTRYRFTGVYAFDPPLLRNIALFDRENPTLHTINHITPLRDAYCSIVHETSAIFTTGDAATDARVADHPARGTYMSYYGVPLRTADGALWGVMCHFDYRPRTMPAPAIPLLDAAARVLGPLLREGR